MSTGGYFGFTPAGAQLSTAAVAAASAAYPAGAAGAGQPSAAAAYAALPTYSASAGGYAYAAAVPGVGAPPGVATYPYAVAAVTRPATSSVGNYTYSSAGYNSGCVAATGFFGAASQGATISAGPGGAIPVAAMAAHAGAATCTPGMAAGPGYCSSLSYSTGLTPAIQTMTPAVRVTPAVNVTPVTGYDAALYAAATNYLQTQTAKVVAQPFAGTHTVTTQAPGIHHHFTHTTPVVHSPAPGTTVVHIQPAGISVGRGRAGMGFSGGGQRHHHYRRPGGMYPNRPPQQVHYCEVCKISCAGPMTYKEHLDGQKHKKKEQQLKDGDSKQTLPLTKTSYRCDLCGVTCTGKDTYNAHVKGAKHVKTVKLHQTLGKPMPSLEPTVIPAQFPGRSANSSGAGANSGKSDSGSGILGDADDFDEDKDIAPVGEDYIEIVSNGAESTTTPASTSSGAGGAASGGPGGAKVITYHCKLCDCTFNDQNAKDMHLKGRRHRLQYKKKVNPDLEVEVKMTSKQRYHHDHMARREMIQHYRSMDNYGGNLYGPMRGPPGMYYGPPPRGSAIPLFMQGPPHHGMRMQSPPRSGFNAAPSESPEDKYVMQRHQQVYPTDEELDAVQKVVNSTEKALKNVSDHFNEHKLDETIPNLKKEVDDSKEDSTSTGSDERLLKGVMRVGNLAKGLLLTKDLNVKLVILCSQKPTMALLYKIYELLPKYYEGITKEKYELNVSPQNGYIKVCNTGEDQPRVTLVLHVTSGMMRDSPAADGDGAVVPDPPDILDKSRCLEALAWLRHAKWFQARCSNVPSCLIVLRVMRDLCQRIPTWSPLSSWVLELLTERVLCSANSPLAPGEAFRRIFEAVSSGILLPSGPGLVDPCERESTDAADVMGIQQREDITASAQHAIRLISFGHIHKVLGVDKTGPSTRRVLGKRPLGGEPKKTTDSNKKIKEEAKDS